ncbi:MAG: hypothetical protein NT154_32960, partial [Verrucomicrobia bacterium]|nr:hypothetical protein [Verrucomicrobiota bacterium]
ADYTYDARGNLTLASNYVGAITLAYDAADRLKRITYPGNRWLDYTCDAAGRRTSMTDQLGYRLTYLYDTAGRLERMTNSAGLELVRYAYDTAGRLALKTLGNGVYTTYVYDVSGQLLTLTNARPGGTALSFFNYTYDSRGRRVAMATHYGRWTYGYDDLGQLTRAVLASTSITVPSQDLTYVYDALGNRIRTIENGVTTEYTANNMNQYSAVGGIQMKYDADGSLTQKVAGVTTVLSITNNFANRVTGFVSTNGQRRFAYDALGFPSVVVRDGVQTYQVHDPAGLGDLVGVYDNSGALMERQSHAFGTISTADGTGPTFLSFDGIGNASEATVADASVVGTQVFRPFGEHIQPMNGTFPKLAFGREFGVAHEADLVFMRARFYDPSIGGFVADDPVGLNGNQINLHCFAQNNPVSVVDPSGDIWFIPIVAGGAAGGVSYWYSTTYRGGDWKWGQFWTSVGIGAAGGALGWAGAAAGAPVMLTLLGQAEIGVLGSLLNSSPKEPDSKRLQEAMLDGILSMGSFNWRNTRYPLSILTTKTAGNFWKDELEKDFLKEMVNWLDNTITEFSISEDPNELIGPGGYGAQNFVAAGSLLPYRINFENATNATAPAQSVTVQNLLATNLDLTAFELSSLGFGDRFFAIPAGSQHYENSIQLSVNGYQFTLQIEAGLNLATRAVYATFRSINPTNGLPPPVEVGFLPPENGTGRGQGHLAYTVRSKSGLPTGTEIRNVASIVFDLNAAIETDWKDPHNPASGVDTNKQALVTIDASAPTSIVTSPSGVATNATFVVCWTGSDTGAGIAGYDIYVSTNGGPWTLWLGNTPLTCNTFHGQNSRTYGFYSVARDGAGNTEAPPSVPDVTTTTQPNYPPTLPAVANRSVLVGQQLVVTNQAYDPDVPIKFSLANSAPAGAAITTDGVLRWTPSCAQGSTTNVITVWATDSGTPPMSNSVSFLVAVPECVEASLGNAVVLAGQTSSVPVLLLSTTALTNLAFTLVYPTERLGTNFTLAVNSSQVLTQEVRMVQTGQVEVSFTLPASSILHGPTNVAQLAFTTVSNQSSAFVSLPIIDVNGLKPDGAPVGNAYGQPGRVVVIGEVPLLEAAPSAGQNVWLILYGQTGLGYGFEWKTNLTDAVWQPGWSLVTTNLWHTIEIPSTNPAQFFRVFRP